MTFCIIGADCCVYDTRTKCSGISVGNIMCDGCDNRTRADLNRLRYDYVDLSQLIPKSGVLNEAQIFRPKPESSVPVNVTAFNLRAQIAYFVCVLAAIVRRREHLSATVQRTAMREGFALDHDLRMLVPRVQDIAALPTTEHYWHGDDFVLSSLDGVGVIAELGALHRRARRVCGLDPRTLRVPGECPHCELPSLRRTDEDKDKIWCAHCQTAMTGDEYAGVMQMKIAGQPDVTRLG